MTIGSLMEGGFRLIRERPGAMLIWTVITLLVAIATSFAMMAIVQGNIDALMSGESVQSIQTSTTVQSLLVSLAGLVVSTILSAAVQRAIIRPDEGGPGWLRLGMDEVRLFLLVILYLIIFLVGFVVAGLIVGLFVAGAGARAVALVLVVLAFIAGAYFCTRVSLSFPLTLKERAFRIGEGWSLTRGRFWTLLGAYLIIFVILLVLGIVNLAITQPEYLSAIFRYGFGSPEAQQASVSPYFRLIAGEIDAQLIIGWVLGGIQGAIFYALFSGAAATAVQQLTADEAGLSETFS